VNKSNSQPHFLQGKPKCLHHQSEGPATWQELASRRQRKPGSLECQPAKLNFPAVLQMWVQSPRLCHVRAPCWVIKHLLGTSGVWDVLSVQFIPVLLFCFLCFPNTHVWAAGNWTC